MDISCFLHACISKPKAALLTGFTLARVPTDVTTLLESNHVSFLKHNIFPYYVFDGCDHLMKAETKTSRCDEKSKEKDELFLFYEYGKDQTEVLTDNNFTVAMRNVKKNNLLN